ncbi:MAG: DNA methyltransferase [Candidatus Methanoperedens sp.]|nr:DNA methyltransferase [Candidatus Methanoperedens sp.]
MQIGETKIKLHPNWNIHNFAPSTFTPETTTVWSFPDRGDWATHVGNYRGNWSPYIPRNLILRYTAPGDLVLDQMAGSGTTLVECKLLGRRAVGVDINPDAVMVAHRYVTYAIINPDIRDTRNGSDQSLLRNLTRKIDMISK